MDDLPYIDNLFFEQSVKSVYPTEFRLNKTNRFDTEAPLCNWTCT